MCLCTQTYHVICANTFKNDYLNVIPFYRLPTYALNIALNLTNTFFLFYFSTRMGEHTLSAGTSDKRMYWLSQLQRARREFSQAGAAAAAKSSMACQVKIFNPSFTKNYSLKNIDKAPSLVLVMYIQ